VPSANSNFSFDSDRAFEQQADMHLTNTQTCQTHNHNLFRRYSMRGLIESDSDSSDEVNPMMTTLSAYTVDELRQI